MLRAAVDLVTGAACPGCGLAGTLLCPGCDAGLSVPPTVAWPSPCPPGLVVPWTAGEYAGLLRTLLLGHKEHAQLGLGRPLGRLLAGAVRALLEDASLIATPVVLVPVPSRRATTRSRGHEPTFTLARRAAETLRLDGLDVLAGRLLRVGRVQDQAGLTAEARSANLTGAMWCPSPGLARLARRRRAAMVVICDDVLTTGATAREAQRALTASGVRPWGVATVAATRKRVTGNVQGDPLVFRRSTD